MRTYFIRASALIVLVLGFAGINQAKVVSASVAGMAMPGVQEQGSDNGREFHWSGKLAPEQVVVIKNINGDIDATASNTDQVEVTGVKSGQNIDQVKINVVKLNDGIEICAVYPGYFGSSNDCDSGSHISGNHANARVDFTIRMPKNLRFTGKNVNGAVNAEGIGRYVEATSVNGGIHVSTESWASATSVNGSIFARLGRTDWSGDLQFRTVNGSVKLELPPNANTDVDFNSVNGHLETDFPLTVQGNVGRHSIHGTLGSGGRSLEIRSVNGGGELRKETL